MSGLKQAPLQRIQDEQGYLIITSPFIYEPWTVLPGARVAPGFDSINCKLVVIGTSTEDEWRNQCRRFNGTEPYTRPAKFFYKVRAE